MGQQQSTNHGSLIILKDTAIKIPNQTFQVMTQEKLGYIYIGNGRWRTFQVGQYTPFIKQWNIRKGLVLDGNLQCYLFKQIIGIKFQYLLELSVRQNNIQSIELLSEIQMPLIEKLYFCQNNISCIRSLRRFNAPNLIYISFNGNQAIETRYLVHLQSEFLEQIFIQLDTKEKKNKESTIISMNSLAKLKSKYLFKIWLGRYHQQKQINCYKTLRQKFKGFQMQQFDRIRNTECDSKKG